MTEWYDRIVEVTAAWTIQDSISVPSRDYDREPGEVVFCRQRHRRNRNRYYVMRAGERGVLRLVNAVIQYQKSRNCWAIFVIDEPTGWSMSEVNGSMDKPVKRYRSLRAAKMALMSNPLDRVGAEIDAICEATNGSEKSSNAGSSAPQT